MARSIRDGESPGAGAMPAVGRVDSMRLSWGRSGAGRNRRERKEFPERRQTWPTGAAKVGSRRGGLEAAPQCIRTPALGISPPAADLGSPLGRIRASPRRFLVQREAERQPDLGGDGMPVDGRRAEPPGERSPLGGFVEQA